MIGFVRFMWSEGDRRDRWALVACFTLGLVGASLVTFAVYAAVTGRMP